MAGASTGLHGVDGPQTDLCHDQKQGSSDEPAKQLLQDQVLQSQRRRNSDGTVDCKKLEHQCMMIDAV